MTERGAQTNERTYVARNFERSFERSTLETENSARILETALTCCGLKVSAQLMTSYSIAYDLTTGTPNGNGNWLYPLSNSQRATLYSSVVTPLNNNNFNRAELSLYHRHPCTRVQAQTAVNLAFRLNNNPEVVPRVNNCYVFPVDPARWDWNNFSTNHPLTVNASLRDDE